MFSAIMITNQPRIASFAEAAKVAYAMVDIEYNGKHLRQANAATPVNRHTLEDLKVLRPVLKSTKLMIRLNPLYKNTKSEVETAISNGADCFMLPYFQSANEIVQFREIVNDRKPIIFLFETSQAAARAEQILEAIVGEEVHFGLNDLMISLGTASPFDSFAGGMVDWLCELAKKKNIRFGVGGMGRLTSGNADKVPAELVLKEHARVGSERVILSRSFMGSNLEAEELGATFKTEHELIQAAYKKALTRSHPEIENDRTRFVEAVIKADWSR